MRFNQNKFSTHTVVIDNSRFCVNQTTTFKIRRNKHETADYIVAYSRYFQYFFFIHTCAFTSFILSTSFFFLLSRRAKRSTLLKCVRQSTTIFLRVDFALQKQNTSAFVAFIRWRWWRRKRIKKRNILHEKKRITLGNRLSCDEL